MTEVVVWGGSGPIATAELAMRRFGLDASLVPVAKPEEALALVRNLGDAVLALDPVNPWWARLLAERRLAAVDLLHKGGFRALALGHAEAEPSGSDHTLWATDAAATPAAVEAALGRIGFAGELVWVSGGLKLFALAGYVQRDDRRLLEAPGRLSGVIGVVPAASVF
jgi:hypothetical protein